MKTTRTSRPNRRAPESVYVWFDLEFTSLDFDRAHLLQAALVLTDADLRRIGDPAGDIHIAVRLPPRARISPWVREILAPLVQSCRSASALSVSELDALLAGRIDQQVGPPDPKIENRPLLAGNSIHADWALARRLLPEFSRRLHYRHLDVTSFKLQWDHLRPGSEFEKEKPAEVLRWFPEAVLETGAGEHDAYYDTQASIAEMAFYRKRLLKTR
ncbi:MAG: exonuclease domain-containing protein [Kiritimatiellia bacterium]|nr:exonuclease domain-containing protein [Kiritimatiellia bacterium]